VVGAEEGGVVYTAVKHVISSSRCGHTVSISGVDPWETTSSHGSNFRCELLLLNPLYCTILNQTHQGEENNMKRGSLKADRMLLLLPEKPEQQLGLLEKGGRQERNLRRRRSLVIL